MLALWLGSGLIATASEPPAEEAPGWAIGKKRHRVVVHGRRPTDEGEAGYAVGEAEATPIASPVTRKIASEPGTEYTGPSAKEIATAALLEASRRLSEDLAAQARREEQSRIEQLVSAQAALANAQLQAELTAEAVRRAQDEEALIALLLAM